MPGGKKSKAARWKPLKSDSRRTMPNQETEGYIKIRSRNMDVLIKKKDSEKGDGAKEEDRVTEDGGEVKGEAHS